MAFYDGLGKKIQKTGQDALEKTRGVAETAKLNSVISDLEKEINATFADLGRAYYNKYAKSIEDRDLLPYFSKIEDRMAQIQANRDKIRSLKGLRKCIYCGQDIETNAVFCNHCGQRQLEETGIGQTAAFRCSNCGAPIAEGQLFCTGCGCRVEPAQQADVQKRFCVGCGQELAPDAVFCTQCGQKNPVEQAAPASGMNAGITAEMWGTAQPAADTIEEANPAGAFQPESYSEESAMTEPAEEVVSEPEFLRMPDWDVTESESVSEEPITETSENADAQLQQTVLFCTNCGSRLEADEIFCSNCGERIR